MGLSALLVLLCSIGPAPAAESVRLVTGTDYPPFSEENLPQGGIATAVVKAAFDAAGWSYTIDVLPWKRGYEAVIQGDADATFPYTPTDERQKEVAFSAPVFELPVHIISAVTAPIDYHGAADLAGKTICAPIGFPNYPPIGEMLKAGRLTMLQPRSLASCARQVAEGRAAFMADNMGVTDYAAREAGVEGRLVARGDILAMVKLHLAVARTNPRGAAILAAFDAGLQTIKSNGTFDALVKPKG